MTDITNNLSDTTLEKIKTLQESQKNTKIWIGVSMGMILLIFFFTFASLVDKAPPIFSTIETIISIIFFISFFILNRISFAILKIRKGKKEKFKAIIEKMSRDDVDEKPEVILKKVGPSI